MISIGFIGIGKLGKDCAELMHDKGFNVTGYDLRKDISTHIKMADSLKDAVCGKDVVFVAIQTPHHEDYDGRYPTSHLEPKDFDYQFVKDAIKEIDTLSSKNTLIVLISTVLPGTVRREIAPLIKNTRFIYNPYLIAQGTVKEDLCNPEMIILGTIDGRESQDTKLLVDFYAKISGKDLRIELGTWEEAEGIKIFYNTFITAKLVLVNMIGDICERIPNMNADVITNALKRSTKRIMGPQYMSAGLGDGGGCHPRDNIALRFLSKNAGLKYDLFSDIMQIREQQAKTMALRIAELSKGRDVCILGKGFKPGVDQDQGSAAILLGYYIEECGLKVYWDGHPTDIIEPLVYVLHHHERYKDFSYNEGSLIFDPFGKDRDAYCYGR
jgi:UDPglucose 6-dehydrogenase